MIRPFFISLLCAAGGLLLLPGTSAQAGSVTLSTANGRQFAGKDGVVLPAGCAIRIGTFSLPDATRNAKVQSTGDYAQLKAWFKPLAEGVTGAGVPQQAGGSGNMLRANSFPNAGDVFGSISEISTSYMAPGTQLYVWVFDNAVPDNATQWGIYTLSTWQAPPSLGSEVISTIETVTALQGTLEETQLRLATPPATYGNWVWKNYSLNAPAATTSATADPDGDGIANMAEYAWGLNALTTDKPRTAIETDSSTGKRTFIFKAPRLIPDVQVIAESSLNLTSWTAASATLVGSDETWNTFAAEAPAGTNCFWRVRFIAITPP